jgi:hypothetical protein
MFDKDTINNLREKIGDVITAQSSLFKAVYSFPKSTMDGYPAVVIMPSENEADYNSTADDRITLGFSLYIYYPIKGEDTYELAEKAIGQCTSDLLRIFSVKGVLGEFCEWVRPVPSVWGEATVGESIYRTNTLTLKCIKYIGNR